MMLKRRPSTPEKQNYFNKLRDAVDPSRINLTSRADLQSLEEGRAAARQMASTRKTLLTTRPLKSTTSRNLMEMLPVQRFVR